MIEQIERLTRERNLLRAIVRELAPTGTPEAVRVRKMTTFEEAEAIYVLEQGAQGEAAA
jgi:hypothetical protein